MVDSRGHRAQHVSLVPLRTGIDRLASGFEQWHGAACCLVDRNQLVGSRLRH